MWQSGVEPDARRREVTALLNRKGGLLTEQQFSQYCDELSALRTAGGVFSCNFKGPLNGDVDSVTVTNRGRILMRRGGDVSVILPDELLCISNKTAHGKWGGFRRRDESSFVFAIRWLRRRPDKPSEPTSTHIFLDQDGEDFEMVVRHVIATRRQRRWKQRQILSERAALLAFPFELKNPPHRDAIWQLWSTCFPRHACPVLQSRDENWHSGDAAAGESAAPEGSTQSSMVHMHSSWRSLGFPSESPGSFASTAGVLGVEQLLYYARSRPEMIRAMLGTVPGEPTLRFAEIGITISQTLGLLEFDSSYVCEPLRHDMTEETPSTQPLARFLHNLDAADALEQVYTLLVDSVVCILFQEYGADMAALPSVLMLVQTHLQKCLTNLPISIDELSTMLAQLAI